MNIQAISSAAQSVRAPEVENDGDADDRGASQVAAKAASVAKPQLQSGETFSILA